MYSQHYFIEINLDPNNEVSMLVCFFSNQYVGAEFRNTIKPVQKQWVTLSPT
jgi:hypothetical protein